METHIKGPSGSIDVTEEGTHIKGPSGEITVTNGIQAGDPLTEETANNIVKNSGGTMQIVEEGGEKYLVGPDGFKKKIGEPLDENDIATINKYAPKAVTGEVSVTATQPSPPPGDATPKAPA